MLVTDLVLTAVDGALAPLELVLSRVLVGAHAALAAAGLPAASGAAWAASVALLVVAVRLALLPLVVRQVRASHRLAAAAPALREVRARHGGARDAASLARRREETARVYAEAGASPLGCLPLLLQAPVLLALYRVLAAAARGSATGGVPAAVALQVGHASLWGVPLAATLHTGGAAAAVVVALAAGAAVALLLAQRVQLARNTPPGSLEGAAGSAQRLGVWLVPAGVLLSVTALPVGVLVYVASSAVWALGQQLAVVRWLPAPGSLAAAAAAHRHGSAPARHG